MASRDDRVPVIPSSDRKPAERELGSEWHWILDEIARRPSAPPSDSPWTHRPHTFFSSGRAALLAILADAKMRGAGRFLYPTYFCQEVIRPLQSVGLSLVAYADAPTLPPPRLEELATTTGDVVLTSGFFGIRGPAIGSAPEGVTVIEDHSHDPQSVWSRASGADYAVASLRKSMPIPDGAVLWSPSGKALPPEAAFARTDAVLAKLEGMVLKSAYLRGAAIEKDSFRTLLADGESTIAEGAVSGISPVSRQALSAIDGDQLREARRRNHGHFLAQVTELTDPQPMPSVAEAVPFAVVLLFSTRARRDTVRRRLIERRVYPTILWSLDQPILPGIPPEHVALADRMLAIPCDIRYETADMEWAAEKLIEALRG